jgi:hypothetical protein
MRRHHPPVLGFEERLWLRRYLDRLARERLAVNQHRRTDRCRACGVHLDECNPACGYCRDRQGRRLRRARQVAAEARESG